MMRKNPLVSRRNLLAASLGTGAAAILPGCVSTNPATGRTSFTGTFSPADDVALGRREHPKMLEAFGGEYQNRRLQSYVDKVGRSLARHTEFQQFPYQFTLLNTPIVNAFALPGGYVYISRGLLALASNEAEMAGVLAHELGHVNARHSAERISAQRTAQIGLLLGAVGARLAGLPSQAVQLGQQIAVLSIQGYSRQQEFEADMLGVRYMSQAAYEPDAMVTFLSTLREQSQLEARELGLAPGKVDQYNMLSTHPRTIDRVREAQAAAQAQRPASARVASQEYLRTLDGMLFGDDPSQGLIHGQRFVHPELRFQFAVPAGFRIQNQPDKVVASDPGGAAIVFDMAPIKRSGSMAQYVRSEWAGRALNELEGLQVNGLRAATGWLEGRGERGPVQVRLLALARDDRSAYRMMFVTPRNRIAELDEPMRRTTFSFRTISAQEAAKAKPLKLKVRRANSGESVAKLASSLPYGPSNRAWFRVLNDLPANAEPPRDKLLKIVSA